jgi:hypothetical protein
MTHRFLQIGFAKQNAIEAGPVNPRSASHNETQQRRSATGGDWMYIQSLDTMAG